MPVWLCSCLTIIGLQKILTLVQLAGERGPFQKSTVKVGLKSVLDTKTCNWDLCNYTALAYIKHPPPR